MKTLDFKRLFLYAVFFLIAMQLWTSWKVETRHDSQKAVAPHQSHVTNVPQSLSEHIQSHQSPAQSVLNEQPATHNTAIAQNRIVHVKTDVLNIAIDTTGGNVVGSQLPKYPVSLQEKDTPFTLMSQNPQNFYVAQSGLTGQDGPDTAAGQVNYQVDNNAYQLQPNQNNLTVNLHHTTKSGLQIVKSYTFTRGSYEINVSNKVTNKGHKLWSGFSYTQLQRTEDKKEKAAHHTFTYTGAAISTPSEHFEKITFKDMKKENLSRTARGGWAAMVQHYFLSAWIPQAQQDNHYYSSYSNGLYTVGVLGPKLTVAPGEVSTTTSKLYTGPAVTQKLSKIAPYLDLTVDYGFLWFISEAIFWLMQLIHGFVGNWGFAIVLVTLTIKLCFYRLSAMSYRSMAKMRHLQPRIESVKQRCGDDKQKFSQELMGLYKKEKVNPLGGCLPILIQIPVFFGLYWVLVDNIALRQAPFIFWIHDLSVKDPFYVLPILTGASMYITQLMSPQPPDPTQATVMRVMPLIFTFMFLPFPAGLVLYWLTNNLLSALQQWYIMRKVGRELTLHPKRK